MIEPILHLEKRLADALVGIGPVVVAFSGGVDSSLLAVAAGRALPHGSVLLATADSGSLGAGELGTCQALADQWGLEWTSVRTTELDDPRYLLNQGDRCYWCKTSLMDHIEPIAHDRSATIVLGVNLDDLGDHRPGQQAAAQRGARFPLVEAELTKVDIRALAKHWGIEVWDRPAMPCLSSRVPYGTPISLSLLSRIDRAEDALRRRGLTDVRVRHYDETARIEVPAVDLPFAVEHAAEIDADLRSIGYRYVTLDLAGLRSGNLNATLSR